MEYSILEWIVMIPLSVALSIGFIVMVGRKADSERYCSMVAEIGEARTRAILGDEEFERIKRITYSEW
jgi:hypothetical protein